MDSHTLLTVLAINAALGVVTLILWKPFVAIVRLSAAFVAIVRLSAAFVRLGVGVARLQLNRRRELRRVRKGPLTIDAWPWLDEALASYAADLKAGRRLPPLEYLRRCERLRARGLSVRVYDRLRECDNVELLCIVEEMTDAQIRDLNREAARSLLEDAPLRRRRRALSLRVRAAALAPDVAGRAMTEIRVVTGPPCSGKSTHILEHAGQLDVVIDLDQIAHALGYPHPHIDWAEGIPRAEAPRAGTPGGSTPHPARVAAMRARASLIKAALDTGFGAHCVWIVDAVLSEIATSRYVNAGATIVRVDPGPDECHRRATADGRPAATHDQIDRWYGELGTTSTDW